MASAQPSGSGAMSRLTADKWEKWKELIRQKYLVEKRESAEIVKILCGQGFYVEKSQLDRQLTSWGFRKSLSRPGWISVDETIQERRNAGKQSLVILSGKRLPSKTVETQTKRYRPLCKYPAPKPIPSDEERDVQVCTPRTLRSRSPEQGDFEHRWPDTLPWIQFSRSAIEILLASIQLIPNRQKLRIAADVEEESETQLTIHDFAKKSDGLTKRQQLITSHCIMRQIINRTMITMVGSEELASKLVVSRSIDCLAARFDRLMPESYPGENLDRAFVLAKGRYADQQAQLLKMLVYLVSNNLIMQDDSFIPRSPSRYFEDEAAFIGLFRLSGLASARMLSELVRISKQSPTLVAVIEALFKAAVRVEAADIVSRLLTTDTPSQLSLNATVAIWINRSWKHTFDPCTPLNYALTIGAIDLAKALIAGGANVNNKHDEWAPLQFAAFQENHGRARQLVSLLIDHGAMLPTSHGGVPSPMQLALLRDNFELVESFLVRGQDAVSIWHANQDWRAINDPREVNYVLSKMKTVDSFAFAALADGPLHISGKNGKDRDETATLETRIIRLMELLIAYSKDGSNSLRQAGASAMIVAAARGHVQVLEFLRCHQPDLTATTTKGRVSPLSAAIFLNQVEACRLLLSWEASTTVDECLKDSWVKGMLSPWHFAALHDSVELGELLLRQGVDLNPVCVVESESQWHEVFNYYPYCESEAIRPRSDRPVVNSPLLSAILLRHEKIATLLIDAGASITTEHLSEATRLGQGKLVAQMLGKVKGSSMYSEQQAAVIDIAMQHRRYHIAQQMVQEGASTNNLPLAAIFGFSTVAIIQRCLPTACGDLRLYERYDGRSYLEVAILDASAEIVTFALSLDTAYYDSGALCAAVSREAGTVSRTGAHSDAPLVRELIKRRDALAMTDSRIDACLESTAIAIAVSFARFDLIDLLVSGNGAQAVTHPAVLPLGRFWYNARKQHTIQLYFSQSDGTWFDHVAEPDIWLAGLQRWRGWHSASVVGCSPIFFAIKQRETQHRHALSKQLLGYGFFVDAYSLMAAIEHDFSCNLIDTMMARCDIQQAVLQRNRLVEVAGTGNLRALKLLVERGVSVTQPHSTACASCLTMAAKRGHLEVVQFLLASGANTEQDVYLFKHWQTALQAAAEWGHIGVVRYLLDHGADIDAPRNPAFGRTALETAAENGRLDTVAFLLSRGVSITGTGRVQYLGAIMLATKRGHAAIAQMLQNAGPRLPEDEEHRKELHEHPWFYKESHDYFVHPAEYDNNAALIETICRIIELYEVCSHCKWWKGNEATCAKLDAALATARAMMGNKWNPSMCKTCQVKQRGSERFRKRYDVPGDKQSLDKQDDGTGDDGDSPESHVDSFEDDGDSCADGASESMLAPAGPGVDIEMHNGIVPTPSDISGWNGYQGDEVMAMTEYEEAQGGWLPSWSLGGAITQPDGLLNGDTDDVMIMAEVEDVPEQEQHEEVDRRQRILADMRGEKELEFEPMEWEW